MRKLLFVAMAAAFGLASCDVKDAIDELVTPPDGTVTEYTVTVETPVNGTATASVAKAEKGFVVTLEATADDTFVFDRWVSVSGDAVFANSRSAITTFEMPAKNVVVSAVFESDEMPGTYDVTLTTAGNGTQIAAPASNVEAGETVTITATPDSGYEFVEWQTTDVTLADATANPATFTMPASDVSITAVYQATTATTYTVNMAATGGNGTQTANPNSNVASGTSVQVTATPDPGYEFVQWQSTDVTFSDATANPATFSMPASDVTITAVYQAVYAVTMAATGGNGTQTANPNSNVASGTSVSITATPDPGYEFVQWQSTDVTLTDATANPATFTMPANDVSITAVYQAQPTYNVTMAASGGTGTQTATPSSATAGTSISITATPDSGYVFVEWQTSDATLASTTAATTTFTMPANNVSITAVYQAATYNVTMTASGDNGTGTQTATPNSNVASGTSVSITATPDSGYVFVEWQTSDATLASTTDATTTFTMPASNVSITAVYQELTYSVSFTSTGGSGTGTETATPPNATAGTLISIEAVPGGTDTFVQWQSTDADVTFSDATNQTTTFPLPAHDVTITAVYQ